jgi:SAM-dependent methyltransferase
VCDAHDLPFADRSVANIVMVDVLHHLGSPTAFLQEAGRVLTVGGRLLLVEPYPSVVSLPVYRRFHPEPFDFSRDAYAPQPRSPGAVVTPNQAIACQLFFRNNSRWADLFAGVFTTVKKQRMASVLYPASGGFGNQALVPDSWVPLLSVLESAAWPFHALSAFRCYVVLQRR